MAGYQAFDPGGSLLQGMQYGQNRLLAQQQMDIEKQRAIEASQRNAILNQATQQQLSREDFKQHLQIAGMIGAAVKEAKSPQEAESIYNGVIKQFADSGIDMSTAEPWSMDLLPKLGAAYQMASRAGLLNDSSQSSQSEYFTPVQTSTGIQSFNNRTGQFVPAVDPKTGKPLLPVPADAVVQGEVSKSRSLGSNEGKNAAVFTNLADTWDVNKQFLVDSIPEIKNILDKTPNSSISNATQQFLSGIVGNTSAADAQAIIQQYGAMFLQGMPFPPGAQSDKEMQARAQVLSDQLVNPNISPENKVKLISNFINWQESKAKAQRQKAAELTGNKKVEQPIQQPSEEAPKAVNWSDL